MPAATPYQQLEQEFRRLHALRGALSLLRWDAAVMMPRGSADVRGEQIAALETECHAVLASPRLSRLLERARANEQGLEGWQRSNVRAMQRQRDHAIAMPPSLIARLAKAVARAESLWFEARRQGDFRVLAPALDEVVKLVRDRAAHLGRHLQMDPYDALLDAFAPGIQSAEFETLLTAISWRLPQLIDGAIERQAGRAPQPFEGRFTATRQRALCVEVMKAMGFPFDRGRLDESERPFTEGVPGDIRVTTHFDPADPFSGLLGALHETGQALYDQGVPAQWRDQPVGRDRGLALEEGLSLLLEMQVGRSPAFVAWIRPLVEKHLGVTGPAWTDDNILLRLLRVRRSLVRVDADELTYPVHIMVRYDLERQLLSGRLRVVDLAEAWNEAMQARFGRRPDDDVQGVLQDMHWAVGSFGYFPTYLLGSSIAAQLWESLREDCPGLDESIRRGEFSGLVSWLRENVHARGASLTAPGLLQEVTRKPLTAAAWLRYVERKYLETL
jgi:carboxypeptidase Taq